MSNRCGSSPTASRLPAGRSPGSYSDSSSSGERPRASFITREQADAFRNRSSHGVSVPTRESETRKRISGSEEFSERELDSCNVKAAEEFRALRIAAGLTQEEAAEILNTTDRTIRNREDKKRDQGPLAERIRLAKIARKKYLAEESKRKG